jgi:hypothetical protein
LLDLIDALRNLLEPTPGATGVTVHDNAAAPLQNELDISNGEKHLWVYLTEDTHELAGVGTPPEEREVFTLEALFVVDDTGEREAGQRLRTISTELDTKVHDYTEIIASNRSRRVNNVTVWDHLASSVSSLEDYRGLDARGFVLRITGYRLRRYT